MSACIKINFWKENSTFQFAYHTVTGARSAAAHPRRRDFAEEGDELEVAAAERREPQQLSAHQRHDGVEAVQADVGGGHVLAVTAACTQHTAHRRILSAAQCSTHHSASHS